VTLAALELKTVPENLTMKPKRRNGAGAPQTVRVNLRIDDDAHQRLLIHSVMTGAAPRKILSDLCRTHLRDWKVSANVVARPVLIDSAIEGHSVDLSAAQAS
jgi:hypothetical protein